MIDTPGPYLLDVVVPHIQARPLWGVCGLLHLLLAFALQLRQQRSRCSCAPRLPPPAQPPPACPTACPPPD